MKVIKITNKYSEYPKMYYNYDNLTYFIDTIIDEVKTNLEECLPINIEVIKMTKKEWEKLPMIN